MADQRTPRRWEGKETQDGKRDIPEKYWEMGYEKWRDRYRTTNVAMSTLKPRKEVQDGFPVGPDGERLDGFFDAGFHARELREKYADSGMNERGIRGVVVGDLQALYNTRRAAIDSAMSHASGPDFHRLSLLRDAEQASLGEHIARLHDQPNADRLIETAKDRFADLQAYDLETNHPIANPDRDLEKAPPTDQERFNWLFGRDGEEHGFRKSPSPGDMFEQDDYSTLIHTDRSSARGVAVRQIVQQPRPANDVDASVREAVRQDALKAMEDLKEAQAYAETLKKDMPPTFEPRAYKETPFQPEADFRPRATEDGERFYRGKLVETGEAIRFEGDPSAKMEPFARLEGRNGENWKVFGAGVPASIKAAGLKEGDDLEIRKMFIDQGGRWVAKAHDFKAHEEEQKAEHTVAEANRKEEFQEKEAQRFEKFEVDALAWKARNPQVVAEERVSNWLEGTQPTIGEPVEQRERRARPALDRVLGRAAPEAASPKQDVQPEVKPDVSAPAPSVNGNGSLTDEVERLRAQRDERLGLNQGARPAEVAPEVSRSDVKPEVAPAAPVSPAPAGNGSLADEVERLRADRDQRLGLNQGARGDATVPNVSEVATKVDQRASVADKAEAEQEQGEGKRQSQGAAGTVGGPSVAQAQPDGVEHAPEVSNTPARVSPPNLTGLAEKVDARADAVAQEAVAPAVDAKPVVEQPAAAQVKQEPVGEPAQADVKPEQAEQSAAPKLPSLAGIGERVDARAQSVAETAVPTVEPKVEAAQAVEPKVDAAAVAQAQPQAQPEAPKVEQTAPVHAESVQPEVKPEPSVEPKVEAAQAVEPKVEPAPAVAPVQPVAEAPKVDAPAHAVEQPVQQPAAQPVAEQAPAVAQAQPQVQPEAVPQQAQQVPSPEQPANRQMPANLPDRNALAIKLSGEIRAFNAEHDASLSNYITASDRGAAQTKKLEEARVEDVSQALHPEQDFGHSQDHSVGDGMRMRMRHRM
ncbi:hypothetical protein [Burkholderia vietnamiensis]|uniref:hypothetical protein n=1 Tax=Burkholderia vietnamiensis TaxID=60552 RepID=UPI001CF3508C|nr:hypothetical protein [Burkholderia vietnamiensis]MCA8448858.1 hypothetical protein [Burkholderia vietnamiensis]